MNAPESARLARDPAAADLIGQVTALIADKLPAAQVPEATAFASQYYARVDPEDLAERPLADLYGAALSHWQFARTFAGGAPKLRVFNPRVEEHGWVSTHTVIEIVNDDMPLLVDSITMEVNRQGLTMHLILHPVMRIERDAEHRIVAVGQDTQGSTGRLESFIHVEVDRRTEPSQLQDLHDGLLRILGDVRMAVEDWQPMKQRLADIAQEIDRHPPPLPAETLAEDRAFLEWLAADNFTLLGYRAYDLVQDGADDALHVVPGSGLGIRRATSQQPEPATSTSFAALPAEVRAQARDSTLLTIAKSNTRSTVHRPGYLDYVGIKRYDDEGRVSGEHRFLGLYTWAAYNTSPTRIPLLRRKVATVQLRAGYLPNSHAAKALSTILEQYPRDELFQIPADELYGTAMGILRLGERQRTRLFIRRDAFGRFYSCLIYVPRENYHTDLRARIQALLMDVLQGSSSEFSVQFSDSPLARVLIIVHTRPDSAPVYDARELEHRIVAITRRWEDQFKQALIEADGEEQGNARFQRWAGGLAAGYREDHAPRLAVHDIAQMETLGDAEALALSLYVPLEAERGQLRFKLYRRGQAVPLSQSLPMLEHMGVEVLEERPYAVRRHDGTTFWIDDFGMRARGIGEVDVEDLRGRFQQAVHATWNGSNENDDFNKLVMLAGLDWRQVSILRAYARHMKQATFTFSQAYIEQALAANPGITAALVELFEARFDPSLSGDRDARQAGIVQRIEALLEDVTAIDEDRILRQYLAVIRATLRTNHYQRGADGGPKPVLSLKFDPRQIPALPEPRPVFEIFVYSPRVEGVHLRGGKVARGGLRWSDRMEDFRTEVLGLVKAQQVKNAVIVPVGSKGGFVLKRAPSPSDREAWMAEGIACYQAYLRGLLDLTDNLVGGQVVPAPDVVRHDADDPYLVVAADKGTASFSDYANAIAAEYGFWLGDAFASGGSAGYDHKKMGITARGAWESAKRHFRSLGLDTQSQDFTVVGVGDMSGDVFGNGMLLSKHIRLVAAFDHRHIFIDPQPDAAASYPERQRLFALPRSSWADYDRSLISAGGGVWPRSAKSIELSPEARAALGIPAEAFPKGLPPTDLLRLIMLAPVDLFYNGGIGTYIKASSESHAEVGDRANDALRVNGSELRVKVVVEGGNLGVTQRGRIEFALRGGLVNTDAIDNSAGVDCSDHEVNIKILLNAVVAEGDLTPKQRDRLLAEMTDEVAQLVLRDNYFQNQVLGVARAQGLELLDEQARYMRHLELADRLNPRIEFLPQEDVLAERRQAKAGLTTPELAVLLAYNKMELFDQVLKSDVPEDRFLATTLERYFPRPLRERFQEPIHRHPLRREIIATYIVNSMVNRVGPTFAHRLHEETGAAQPDIVRAYLGAREVFNLVPLWLDNEALDNKVSVETQNAIVRATVRLLVRGTVWLLQHRDALQQLAATIEHFSPGVSEVAHGLERWIAPHERTALDEETARLIEQGVPEPLARRVARLDAQFSGLDIVEVANDLGREVEAVAAVYFGVGGMLELHWISKQIGRLPVTSHWQGLARVAMRDDLSTLARDLARSVMRLSPQLQAPDALIANWSAQREFQLRRCRQLIADLKPSATLDMAMLSVVLREFRALI